MKKIDKHIKIVFVINFLLSIIQIAIGYSANFRAVVAEGVYSFTYLISNIIGMIGDRLSKKRANKEHPFGYGMVQYLTAIFIGFIIIIIALILSFNIINLKVYQPNTSTSLIIIAIIIIKLFIAKYFSKKEEQEDNKITESLVKEIRSDSISSAIVLLLLTISYAEPRIMEILPVDRIATLIISFFIIKTGIELIIENSREIVGRKYEDENLTNSIKECLLKEKEINKIKKVSVLKYGPYLKVDIDVLMSGKLTIRVTNNRIIKIKKEIKKLNKKIKYITILVLPK